MNTDVSDVASLLRFIGHGDVVSALPTLGHRALARYSPLERAPTRRCSTRCTTSSCGTRKRSGAGSLRSR